MDPAHQRVHPVGATDKSSTMNSAPPQLPPKYIMLSDNQGGLQPPPYRRNIPRYHSAHHKPKSCCLRCICWCYCFLFLFIIILTGLAFYFYVVFKPQMPSYSVEDMEIGAFEVQTDFSLYTEFVVTVKAENPNKNIGFNYGKDSSVVVVYSDSKLCSGEVPAFHQGHKNTTMMKLVLKGKSEYGSGLHEALMQNQKTGRIPLLIHVKTQVTVVLGELSLKQFNVFVTCYLVVDNLSPKKKVGILSSDYDVLVTL
ncbi:hypothetical protein L1049_024868 [Liquidambar formosana]|uniref:Late embryogenesis abundant protein LEA-2 subgroup domain-containing protein n=1 Tax=Liquidambar formosana TaxID=63359 RepID=A0AAP0WYT2_LIQFO